MNFLNKRTRAMNEEWRENLASYFQRMLPLLCSLLMLFFSYVPLDLPISNHVRPSVGMICAYFWLLHRPDVFNLFSVYVLGLVEDVISSAPVGSNIFAMLVMYLLVTNLSRFFNAKPFVIIWYGFVLFSLRRGRRRAGAGRWWPPPRVLAQRGLFPAEADTAFPGSCPPLPWPAR